MPSPFPGMDPYLEVNPYWSDLHSTLISVMKAELQRRVPATYSVWSDVYIWLHEPDAETRRGKPDVFMSSTKVASSGTALMSAPAHSVLPAVRRTGNKYLKIKEARSDRVITVIELLSPANKEPGEDREAYLAKRKEYLATGTNLVEIDLLREGRRMPMGKPTPPAADYYIVICQAANFPSASIWPLSVRERLPELPIPLKPGDTVVPLTLQTCYDTAYDAGPYQREIDYRDPPRIPLSDTDAVWAKSLMASQLT